ncbi:hypothetical protein D4739_03330 [Nocardioides cavernaquae]|uniref:Uncharacterized protein n=1 Tax=Nocardioides cavernaquae TaxID=2321396 RepID=A0A3A5H3Y0_9ACTN|nr:hypothetical protein D4739_03330 [Nocardioides cavernaquae]
MTARAVHPEAGGARQRVGSDHTRERSGRQRQQAAHRRSLQRQMTSRTDCIDAWFMGATSFRLNSSILIYFV